MEERLFEIIEGARAELVEFYENSNMTSYCLSLLMISLGYLEDYVRTRDYEDLERAKEEASGLLGSEIVFKCIEQVEDILEQEECNG